MPCDVLGACINGSRLQSYMEEIELKISEGGVRILSDTAFFGVINVAKSLRMAWRVLKKLQNKYKWYIMTIM